MATLIEIESGRRGYGHLIDHVLRNGTPRTARDLKMIEADWTTVVMLDPTDALPVGIGRNLSTRVAAAEAVQLVAGRASSRLLLAASPRFSEYLDPGADRFHGAYGDRIGHQLVTAVDRLRADPGCRRAVITLWDPSLDGEPGHRDYPCTVALHLTLWRGRLDMNVTMRSSDLFLGIPYDWFQFTQLQLTAARALDVEVGVYRHTSWSLHVYETDLAAANALRGVEPPADAFPAPGRPLGFGADGDDIALCVSRARLILAEAESALATSVVSAATPGRGLTDSERWYRDRLTTVVG